MRKIRRLVYKLGFRPGINSIFRSPSLELHYAFKDEGDTVVIRRQLWTAWISLSVTVIVCCAIASIIEIVKRFSH